jgi:MoxR-like ATPase
MHYPTNYDEFLIAEINEYGYDYVDIQFASGLEPTEVNGVWLWRPAISHTPVIRNTSTLPYTPVNLLVTF